MIGIIDYGLGNLANVQNACEKLSFEAVISSEPHVLGTCRSLILPGVGAFKAGMAGLKAKGLDGFVKTWALEGRALFGICLGMQLLFEQSHENGLCEGLGLIPGEVVPITGDVKVPHMGYNQLHILKREDPLMQGIEEGEHVYFVHSYHAKTPQEFIVSTTDYADAGNLTAIVRKGNVCATQFHPEKSAQTGMKILKNFLENQK